MPLISEVGFSSMKPCRPTAELLDDRQAAVDRLEVSLVLPDVDGGGGLQFERLAIGALELCGEVVEIGEVASDIDFWAWFRLD